MTTKPSYKPWHEVVQLRDDLKTGELSLTQAVVKVDRCAMVASLLASDPRKQDDNKLLRDVSEVFGRQMEEDASPVSKEDVAEVLRRRFFKPESISDIGAFRPHVTSVVSSIAALDEQTQKERGSAEGHKVLTQELMVLIGAAKPDKIELEKALRRWTELSWFLDEVEVSTGSGTASKIWPIRFQTLPRPPSAIPSSSTSASSSVEKPRPIQRQ